MAERRAYEFGPFRLEAKGRLLFRDDQAISLPLKAVDTLLLLVENAGSVVEKEEILKQVWQGAFVEEGSLTRTISILRKTLSCGEDGQELIATVPKRGYRLVVPVKVVEDRGTTFQAVPQQAARATPASKRTGSLAITSAVFVIAAVSGYFILRHPGNLAEHDRRMMAVLPFENLTGDSAKDFVSDGLTEEMITQLGRLNPQQLGVIARTSAMTYKASTKPVGQIGKELGVEYVLEGSVRTWGDRIRISAQLIQVSDQTHLWAENYDRSAGDVLTLESEVSQDIAQQIRVKLTPQIQQQMSVARPVKAEAYEDYLKGRFFWEKRTAEGIRKAIDYFNQALQIQPDYAPAYVGLADSNLMLAGRGITAPKEVLPQAKASALKALEIDPNLGDAYASLGHIRLHSFDWSGLDEQFRHAIELNPANAFAYYYYSEYLMAMGRADEAIDVVKKAQGIDPVSPIANVLLPSQYLFARQYDAAIDLLNKAIDLDANYFLFHFRLGQMYMAKGRNEQAIAEMQKAATLSERTVEELAGLAQAYAAAGMKQQMQNILKELDDRSGHDYVSPYYVAKVYAAAKDSEKTFAWLQKSYDDRDVDLIELKIEPAFDHVRTDPRFTALLRRVGWSD